MKIRLISFAAPMLASGLLMAQAPAPAPAQPPAQHQRRQRGQMFEKMAAKLNLTDTQKAQAKSIWQSARETSRPVAEQLRQARMALRQAAKAGQPAANIDQLAANTGQLTGQLAAVRAKAFEQFYAMLTPEQRTTADQLGNHFHGMFMHGHGNAPGAGAGS